MDRNGALPDRCVICNDAAGGKRVTQKLYWSPFAWKLFALSAPFVAITIGLMTETWWMAALFWPLVIVLVIANFFVRKSLRVELGLCERHRRIRSVLRVLSIACIVGLVASIWSIGSDYEYNYLLLWGSIGGILLLAVMQSFTGIRTLTLKELSDQHAWLARTGKPFRAALPELPG